MKAGLAWTKKAAPAAKVARIAVRISLPAKIRGLAAGIRISAAGITGVVLGAGAVLGAGVGSDAHAGAGMSSVWV